MLRKVSTVHTAIERRRGEVERAANIQGSAFKITYFLELDGAGEATIVVNFPVWFQEKPGVSHGGELLPGAELQSGNFPWCSVMVSSWETEDRSGNTYYKGATLVLVVGGTTNQKSILHFHAEGKALQNPIV